MLQRCQWHHGRRWWRFVDGHDMLSCLSPTYQRYLECQVLAPLTSDCPTVSHQSILLHRWVVCCLRCSRAIGAAVMRNSCGRSTRINGFQCAVESWLQSEPISGAITRYSAAMSWHMPPLMADGHAFWSGYRHGLRASNNNQPCNKQPNGAPRSKFHHAMSSSQQGCMPAQLRNPELSELDEVRLCASSHAHAH